MINQDYFQLMGLPERYQTDLDALERSFRSVQSSVHPDRFVRAMDADRRLAMQMSTQANEAYRVLASPVERALYLCRRRGAAVDTDRGAGLNQAFLEDQMRWREQLDEGRGDPVAMRQLQDLLEAAQSQRVNRVQQLIDVEADYAGAAEVARELLFIEKFRQSLLAAARVN